MDNEIVYKTGDGSIIDEAGDLWNELNRVHFEKSRDFKAEYQRYTFQDRRRELLNKGELFIIIALLDNEKIGYCISSLSGNVGEIDSIYIKPNYRGNSIGSALIKKSLDWIRSSQAEKIILRFIAGNEEVLNFYSKFGFKPSHVELQL